MLVSLRHHAAVHGMLASAYTVCTAEGVPAHAGHHCLLLCDL